MNPTVHRFEESAAPLRREIKLHCYRMLGSLHDAEDAVQDAYLRAWRGFDGYKGGSFRAWLYRIATNTSLDLLAQRKIKSRVLPDQLGPAANGMPDAAPALDGPWLEPYPDAELEGIADGAPTPEAHYTSREAVQLAFIAAIQELPPRQRALLILCDVLGWAAAEAASLVGGSTAAVNSALQRAREKLSLQYPAGRPSHALLADAKQQELLARYVRAWEEHDLDSLVALLKEDATVTMPPWSQWYRGRDAIHSIFGWAWKTCGGMRLLPTTANGQPAFGVYGCAGPDEQWNAQSIQVLTIVGERISAITVFLPPTGPTLFEAFALPAALADSAQ